MYARILVPFDGSPASERGLIEGVGLAAAMKSRLVVLSVASGAVGPMDLASARSYEESTEHALSACQRLADSAGSRAIEVGLACEKAAVESHGRSVGEVILEEAATRGCDLIVMGTHGRRGLSRLVLGSNAEAVVRRSEVPVLLVRVAP